MGRTIRGGWRPRQGLVFVGLATLLLWGAAPVRADEEQTFDARTEAALQQIITAQLKAFDKGDAAAAESFAAPDIKQRFPEPSEFLAMVKEGYGALIHARSTQFAAITASPHGPLQKVTVVAADGTVWSATYSFEKVDGQWRITGCGLAKDDTQQAI